MSTELDTYLALNKDLKLANNRAAQREAESARLNTELSLPPADGSGSARSDETAMPDGGTLEQRSVWRRYSYDRPGSVHDAGHGVNEA